MSTPDIFTIGLVQRAVRGTLEATVEAALAGAREAADRGAQIICLQELFHAPYFCKRQCAERFELAEPIPGPITERVAALARERGVVVVAPIFERRAPGLYHNSAAVIDADGSLLGVYRKMHIPDDPLYFEKYYFTPGDAGDDAFRVFRTRYADIGVLICWDQWYPEAARITALKGAEILFYPTAIGWHPAERADFGDKQRDAWTTVQRAHAVANGVYVAAPNRVGHEDEPGTDGITFFGGSFVCDPFGEVLARAPEDADAVLVVACSRAAIEATRRNWPFLRDRRIDAYHPITRRYLDS